MNPSNRSVLLIRVSPDNSKKEDSASELFSQLAEILKGKKMMLSAEIVIHGKFLWFFVTCPSSIKDIVKGQWYSQYPHAEIEEIKDYALKLFGGADLKYTVGCELYYEHAELIPINTFRDLDTNPIVSLSGIANSFSNDETGIIQLVMQPQKKETVWNKIWKRMKGRNTSSADYAVLQRDKEEKPYYKTTFRFIAQGKIPEKANLNLSSMIAVYKKMLERPKLQKFKVDNYHTDRNFVNLFLQRALGRKKYKFSPDEIATIFHPPHAGEEITQVVQVRSKRAPAPQDLPRVDVYNGSDLAIFGETNYQNEKVVFGTKTAERRRHMYIIGKSGMGKSKLLELLMYSDLMNNRGFILMDPHGDLAQEVLNLIPESRAKDVVFFDPSDVEYPIGFNPMEGVGSFEFRQNIVAGFISIFKKLFGLNWNERFEHVLRYTTLALLEYPQASILGIPRMLTDNLFRQDVISYITDPLVKKFWTTEFSAWNEQFASEAIVPIINKIGQFVANPMIRNIVGQAKTGFSLDEIMNQEKILIVNFSKGKLGEENSALLGSMLITKIWETAIARATMPEESRKDAFLYVDEFQNFATSTFANILSEARKYRLNLTVAHQYMQQLPDEVRATIFGNVSNILSFRVGGEDAHILVKEFEPTFGVNDFLNLDLRNFFIKMSIEEKTAQPFSATTINVPHPQKNMIDVIVHNTRSKYAKSKQQVEEEIERWEKGKLSSKGGGSSSAPPSIQTPPQQEPPDDFFPEPVI